MPHQLLLGRLYHLYRRAQMLAMKWPSFGAGLPNTACQQNC